MNFDLEQSIALLSRTPIALDSLLRDLPLSWTAQNEGVIAGKASWSVHEVVAHLIHTERFNWISRAKWLIEFGESRSFQPVDRHVTYDSSTEVLLVEFAQARSESLRELSEMHLTVDDFARRGVHPKFGVVTLAQLLATWTVHDLTHLHQISRILAHQYREAVGPWSEFLGVLRCNGHSSF